MEQKDKKEIAKILGDVLEQNVLPILDDIRQELTELSEGQDQTNRKLDNAIDRYDSKLENHEKRLTVLEKVKR